MLSRALDLTASTVENRDRKHKGFKMKPLLIPLLIIFILLQKKTQC